MNLQFEEYKIIQQLYYYKIAILATIATSKNLKKMKQKLININTKHTLFIIEKPYIQK